MQPRLPRCPLSWCPQAKQSQSGCPGEWPSLSRIPVPVASPLEGLLQIWLGHFQQSFHCFPLCWNWEEPDSS